MQPLSSLMPPPLLTGYLNQWADSQPDRFIIYFHFLGFQTFFTLSPDLSDSFMLHANIYHDRGSHGVRYA